MLLQHEGIALFSLFYGILEFGVCGMLAFILLESLAIAGFTSLSGHFPRSYDILKIQKVLADASDMSQMMIIQ